MLEEPTLVRGDSERMYRGEEVSAGPDRGARWDCSGFRVMRGGHPTEMVSVPLRHHEK